MIAGPLPALARNFEWGPWSCAGTRDAQGAKLFLPSVVREARGFTKDDPRGRNPAMSARRRLY